MNTNGRIPLVDLITPHRELEEELVSVFKTALNAGGFVGGPMVRAFERGFAEFCRVQHCVGVGSGTDALRLALMAAGVVLTPSLLMVGSPGSNLMSRNEKAVTTKSTGIR